MHGTKLPKILAATGLAVAAFGAAPLAQAGAATPQKHPDIIGVLKHPDLIGVLKHPDLIGVLKHPDGRRVPQKHPDIIAVLKHPDLRKAGGTMRKAGGDS